MSTKPKRKAPAFPLYVDDFLAGTMEMSQAEAGAYIRLLCHQWNRGSIPVEPEKQQRLAGGSVSADVLAKFRPAADGQLKNERLESVRAEREAFCEKQAEKGRKSAEARRLSQPQGNHGSTAVQPECQPDTKPKSNSPSPSPSPNKDISRELALEAPASNPPPSPKQPKVRERNLLLDTLATLTGAKLEEVTSGAFSAAAKALADIREVCPDVTPDEIQRRAKNLSLSWGGKPVNANALAKWWADADKMPQKSAPTVMQSAASKPKPAWQQIKELEARIWDHPANFNSLKSRTFDPTWTGDVKAKDKAEYKALREKLEALQQGQTDFPDEP